MKSEQDICITIPPGHSGLGKRRRRYSDLASWYGSERAAVEISAHTCQPKKIDVALDDILSRIKRPENGVLITLKGQWSSIVGAMFAKFCEPEVLRDGVLTLKVRHSALVAELKPSCDLIIKRVNSIIGSDTCKEIRLRV